MLIECPDCLNQISASATACPHCGHPFEPLPVAARPAYQYPPGYNPSPPVQTVELTSKRYKARQIIGLGMLLLGLVIAIVAVAATTSYLLFRFGLLVMVCGVALWIIAGLQAWWNHG